MSASAAFIDQSHAAITGHDGKVQTIEFKKAVIATVSTPSRPPIKGIEVVKFFRTNLQVYFMPCCFQPYWGLSSCYNYELDSHCSI
jgi:pyruvate/2-oxoglutarate dehydrogenase complex dihydrolipoamide dehydrogenase (E3) component